MTQNLPAPEKLRAWVPAVCAVLAGLFYFFTLAPGLNHTDAGELALVADSLGVAHPTGYPLFTILGWLFLKIPIGPVIWQMNLLALLFTVGGVYVFSRTALFLLEKLDWEEPESKKETAKQTGNKQTGTAKQKTQAAKRKSGTEKRKGQQGSRPTKAPVRGDARSKKQSGTKSQPAKASRADRPAISGKKSPAKTGQAKQKKAKQPAPVALESAQAAEMAKPEKEERQISTKTYLLLNILAAMLGTLFMAFARTFWAQSTSVEVYSLHILLSGLVLFSIMKAVFAPEEETRPWLWVAAAVGLSFTNHLTTFLILPGLAYLIIRKHRLTRETLILGAKMAGIAGAIILLLYGFLYLNASGEPKYAWGNPSDFAAFKYHVLGRQFSSYLFTGVEAAQTKLTEFVVNFPLEWGYLGFLLAIPGGIYLRKKHRPLLIFLLISFVFCVGYVINYSIYDLEPYFMLAYLVTGLLIVVGLRWLFIHWRTQANIRWAVSNFVGVVLILQIALNFQHNNQSQLHIWEDYPRYTLSQLPQNAIVITRQWNSLISCAWYLQEKEDFRKDIDVIGYNLLRDRQWYQAHMKKVNPRVYERIEPAATAFYKELEVFAYEPEKANIGALSSGFENLFFSIILQNPDRPVFLATEIPYGAVQEHGLNLQAKNLVPMPYGNGLYQVIGLQAANDYQAAPIPEQELRIPDNWPNRRNVVQIRNYLAQSWLDRANYELAFEKPEKAKAFVDLFRKYVPEKSLPAELAKLQ